MSRFRESRPVGEVFTDEKGVRLKVVPRSSCNGCHYDDGTIYCHPGKNVGKCSSFSRKDKTSVVFVEVKGGQNE